MGTDNNFGASQVRDRTLVTSASPVTTADTAVTRSTTVTSDSPATHPARFTHHPARFTHHPARFTHHRIGWTLLGERVITVHRGRHPWVLPYTRRMLDPTRAFSGRLVGRREERRMAL